MINISMWTIFTEPFVHVGVDDCGPFFVKELRARSQIQLKTYVAIFVCLATKAVHLELADDLSAEAFIACLKRFFARPGQASTMHSDNGTNFVGANSELKKLYKEINSIQQSAKTKQYLAKKEVTWHFILPRAPQFGGSLGGGSKVI